MLNQNDRIERFAEVINENAATVCKKLKKQIASFEKKGLSALKEEAESDFQSKLKFEKDRISSETNKSISEFEAKSKKEIAKRRDEITHDVFAKAKEKLCEFTKSESYAEFLSKSIKALCEKIGENCVIYVRAQDAELAKSLVNDMAVLAVKESTTIKIGGACASNETETFFADDSLDVRLEECREWFMAESGLALQQ